ncbi:trimethyllysine dioxygenase [Marivibrio halodurans]|uniref:trimethyllysine dioxygenase n=1 Tax=Marivibrio halodurans TaxID=2039722 RepID=A0A8J7V357_9PROT|nr:trimethyllysine dioxygenase [Marivibrio halodurans]MBP5857876.1 trimethyllysine dioxygenase [Marivibrio halodurans]
MARESVTAEVSADGKTVTLDWGGGATRRFPALWLRDHCETPESLHPDTLQRQVDVFTFEQLILAREAAVTDGGRVLTVRWRNEDHESVLSLDFLRRLAEEGEASEAPLCAPVLWPDAGVWDVDALPSVPHAQVMDGDEGLRAWLEAVARDGFGLVDGVPATPEATRALAERVGYLRQTVFGDFWDFTANLARADTAYTNLSLTPHTDSTYSHDAPGLQMFHVIEFDGEGGESVLVDGVAIAEEIRAKDPAAFEVLSTVAVPARYLEEGLHLEARRPVFRLDRKGAVEQVSFNHHDRAPFLLPEAEQEAFYRAYGLFHRMANERARQLVFGLRPGRALLFDNWRTLHGRLAYHGRRRLCGAYHNREDFESKLRTLRGMARQEAA